MYNTTIFAFANINVDDLKFNINKITNFIENPSTLDEIAT